MLEAERNKVDGGAQASKNEWDNPLGAAVGFIHNYPTTEWVSDKDREILHSGERNTGLTLLEQRRTWRTVNRLACIRAAKKTWTV